LRIKPFDGQLAFRSFFHDFGKKLTNTCLINLRCQTAKVHHFEEFHNGMHEIARCIQEVLS
jgi:hypothetical protein